MGWIRCTGGGGGGAQVALTQAEYDALVQAGTVDPTTEYFITDGIPEGDHLHITLTQAEYDALVQAGTVDPNAFYFISDGSPNTYTAKQLFFDDAYYSTSQMGTTIALSESMANFDMIAIRGGYIATDNILKDTSTRFILKSEIEDLINNYPNKTWVCSFFQHATYGISAVLRFPGFSQIIISDIAQPGYSGTVGRVVEVTGIRFDSFGGGTHQYSTEEQVVGKWIDGSLIYEKTLIFNNKLVTGNNSTSELVHGISNLGTVSFIVSAYYDFTSGGTAWVTGTGAVFGYRVSWKLGSTSIYMVDVDQLSFSANPDRYFMFVVRYTKSSS